ncbi:MAG: class I SAM-dependent RNA methyltransferase [Halanaerobiales bacterium]|nr:class I SAM-dependent RNA methyltransferase [Halanaerobiales bacterium]
MLELKLIATTTFGLESIVNTQVTKLGYEIERVENGQVVFQGDLAAIPRTNLWLRSAERVLILVGEFIATDFDQLYEKTKELPWEEWLPENAEFPVAGKSVKSILSSVPACQSIVKKAIVDKMKEKYRRQRFPEDGPRYQLQIALLQDRATLTIDTSGQGLHKRGYRQLATEAPLQETLAAAMIQLSRWEQDRILIDPFCGSGTIPIEAALLAKNIAPGLQRSFAAEKWPNLPLSLWKKAREEARELVQTKLKPRLIMGTDLDLKTIGIARYHSRQAGVDDLIHWQEQSFKDFSNSRKYGYIISNPPYGERLKEGGDIAALYRLMGEKLRQLDTWSLYILTSHRQFESLFGKKASKRRKLYNGGIECQYYQYFGPWPPRKNKINQ